MRIVIVRWWDAVGTAEWTVKEEAKDTGLSEALTIGHLLYEDTERIVICHSLTEDLVNGVFAIPMGCVFEIERVSDFTSTKEGR